MCSANGPSTPGLRSPLAKTRRPVLPSSVNRPWAVSNRKQSFRSSIPFRAGQPVPTFHPHYLSVYASTRHFGEEFLIDGLQHSILGLWLGATHAGTTPARHQTISSPHVHRFVKRPDNNFGYKGPRRSKAFCLRSLSLSSLLGHCRNSWTYHSGRLCSSAPAITSALYHSKGKGSSSMNSALAK